MFKHLIEIHPSVFIVIDLMNDSAAHVKTATTVELRLRRNGFCLKRYRRRDCLEHGTRLIVGTDCLFRQKTHRSVLPVLRVHAWDIDHCKDRVSLWVQNRARGSLAIVCLEGVHEGLLREILDVRVDRQHNVLAWYRLENVLCDSRLTWVRPRDPVRMSPIRTSKLLVVLEFNSRKTLVVRARDADHRRHKGSQRIDPAIAFVEYNSRYVESAQSVILHDVYLLVQVDEARRCAAYLLFQLWHRCFQDGSNADRSQMR